MSEHLTDEDREAIGDALRKCRQSEIPVPLIAEGDILHVGHMVGLAVERIVTRHRARAWDEGERAGQHNWARPTQSIANPYRDALLHEDSPFEDKT